MLIAAMLLATCLALPAAAQDACARDVEADLVTIADRLAHGRLDAARAYVVDLLACPAGHSDARVYLALASIEERHGNLDAAATALGTARVVCQGDVPAEVDEAIAAFSARWVRVNLVAVEPPAGDPPLQHAGLVTNETTTRCLAALLAASERVVADGLGRTAWIVPGDYRVGDEEIRLAPGSTLTVAVARPAMGEQP